MATIGTQAESRLKQELAAKATAPKTTTKTKTTTKRKRKAS